MAALTTGDAEAPEGRTPGDVIYDALEHLTSGEFKRFKNKLSDFSYQGGSSIPRGRLEHEDRIAVKDILVNVYGAMTALDVMLQVLKAIGFRGIAERLVKSIQTDLQLLQISPEKCLEEYREHYIDHLKSKYSTFEERNARIGEVVSLQSRYTRLLIIKKHRNEVEREHEIRSCGRRHLQIMDNRSSHEYLPTDIDLLFSPDEHKVVPRTVVLQGPAGIGKTMTSQKIMLDWASGNLWQEMFSFVFYLNCRKLNAITKNISLAKLLCQVCHLNYEQGLLNSIFKEPEKLLFVIDGFDEYKCSVEMRAEVCENPFQEVPKQILLNSFLRKRMLGGCSLIITTRPFLLMNLQQLVKHPRYVEILGFTGNDRQEYCYNFFKDKGHANLALSVIMDNDTIFTMCAVPITCWIVCTVIKQKIERGVHVVNNCNTTTSIYLLYLKSLLTTGSNQVITCIKKLCALANEGVWNQKILFEEEDVQRHGLSLLDEESAFLIQNIFLQDIDIRTCYSFIHLSIQEFFAALYYVLVDESERHITYAANEHAACSEIWTLSQLLKTSVGKLHLELTVQFLFGLVGDIHQTRRCLGCPLSFNEISVLETWLKNLGFSHSCRIFRLLYETDDANLIERTMSRFSHIDIKSRDYEYRLSDMDYRTLAHCLIIAAFLTMNKNIKTDAASLISLHPIVEYKNLSKNRSLIKLDLSENNLQDSGINLLHPELKHRSCNIQELRLRNCGLTSLSCEDLCSVIAKNRSLIKLDLSENNLQDSGINLLHPELKHRSCNIQELRLEKCGLTSSSCGFLCSVLRNPSLITLDLSSNDLQDSGIKCLSKILGHVRCSLQNLRLNKCGLSSFSCGGLSSVIITNRYLTTLDLANNNLQDIGIRRLCEGLKHADCTLQELRLNKCNLTYSCCYEIRSAIAANHSLIKLCLSYNNLMDSGIKLLCEVLRSPGCTLRELRLEQCGLTSHCYDDLKSVIKTNLFLTTLHLNTDNIKSMRKEFQNLKRPPAAKLDLRILTLS
ncbi:PREDICTED: NACHT, LRR and PYD domains-containing protein 3-like [Nanorana parkeri]|uniref:NACHT, LRR and PYD domains-containing protein 3-like n=1 Tax=Nanorana parkeri TaxID=125878 RepID=UPI00085472EE|nr:PREDICTED: NACHT, LRR and PYD domains-containing protein 3-like [Nanorana parkeri]